MLKGAFKKARIGPQKPGTTKMGFAVFANLVKHVICRPGGKCQNSNPVLGVFPLENPVFSTPTLQF